VLGPWLARQGVFAIPTIITTKRVLSGPDFKGGDVRLSRFTKEMRLLLNDTDACIVTSFVDYYGFDTETALGERTPTPDEIEAAINASLNSQRALPYLQVYEYEAIMFSDPSIAEQVLGRTGVMRMMQAALVQCGSAENINSTATGHPSARILAVHPQYNKIVDGVQVASRLTIEVIRERCPRFSTWIDRILARCASA
jgi:hypothetical protein